MMTKFTPHTDYTSRDMQELRRATKGQVGHLMVGQDKLEVLKVSEGLYVTDKPVPESHKLALAIDRQDVHQIRGRADMVHFLERHQLFQEANDGQV